MIKWYDKLNRITFWCKIVSFTMMNATFVLLTFLMYLWENTGAVIRTNVELWNSYNDLIFYLP